MADKYERFMMKEKLKEARHQARLEELRRKRELAEIKDIKAKARSRNIKEIMPLIVFLICTFLCVGLVLLMIFGRRS